MTDLYSPDVFYFINLKAATDNILEDFCYMMISCIIKILIIKGMSEF